MLVGIGVSRSAAETSKGFSLLHYVDRRIKTLSNLALSAVPRTDYNEYFFFDCFLWGLLLG